MLGWEWLEPGTNYPVPSPQDARSGAAPSWPAELSGSHDRSRGAGARVEEITDSEAELSTAPARAPAPLCPPPPPLARDAPAIPELAPKVPGTPKYDPFAARGRECLIKEFVSALEEKSAEQSEKERLAKENLRLLRRIQELESCAPRAIAHPAAPVQPLPTASHAPQSGLTPPRPAGQSVDAQADGNSRATGGNADNPTVTLDEGH